MNLGELGAALLGGPWLAVVAVVLIVCLWAWRHWRTLEAMPWWAELGAVLAVVLPLASWALVRGRSWPDVLRDAIAFGLMASGWNRSALRLIRRRMAKP